MAKNYDLIVIGAGMAGVSAATKCAAHGWDVARMVPGSVTLCQHEHPRLHGLARTIDA